MIENGHLTADEHAQQTVAEMIEAWDQEDALEEIDMDFDTTTYQKYKGLGQEMKRIGELDVIDFESNDPLPIVGLDNRVYEMRHGLIECLAPVKLDKGDPDVYVKKIDWSRFPPETELSHLFETFFSQYDREVLMLVGWCRDGSGCRYHVPWQEGTAGRVTWKADLSEMGEFQSECFWVGTIHSHPGNSSRPSQTDIDDWALPEKSGLHLIFAKDGTYKIHGAIAGRTFEVGSGTVSDTSPTEGYITTSRNQPYKDLLTRPAPVVLKSRKKWVTSLPRTRVTTGQWAAKAMPTYATSSNLGTWVECLEAAGALGVEYQDSLDLSLVMTEDSMFILTPDQWEVFATNCEEHGCALPKRHTLALQGGGL